MNSELGCKGEFIMRHNAEVYTRIIAGCENMDPSCDYYESEGIPYEGEIYGECKFSKNNGITDFVECNNPKVIADCERKHRDKV